MFPAVTHNSPSSMRIFHKTSKRLNPVKFSTLRPKEQNASIKIKQQPEKKMKRGETGKNNMPKTSSCKAPKV